MSCNRSESEAEKNKAKKRGRDYGYGEDGFEKWVCVNINWHT